MFSVKLRLFTVIGLCFFFVKANDIYLTCDFDLDNIDAIVPLLPQKCQDIFAARLTDKTRYEAYLKESQQFAEFQAKLQQYEQQNATVETAESTYDAEFRQSIYEQQDWSSCINNNPNETDLSYLQCLTGKRAKLIALVPDVGKEV